MTDFDLIVVGGGTGNNVAAAAAEAGLKTGLVEPGLLGGTCLNRGCNPSKMLIQAANAANQVREAGKFHVDAELLDVDHAKVVSEMQALLGGIAESMESRYREKENLTLFKEYTRFLDDRTLALGGDAVTAEKIVLANGSRPIVPSIDGLSALDFLTSDDALRLRERPDRLVVLGGGYIAVELGYYFQSVGTAVTIIEMEDTLLPREDPEVAQAFTDIAADRHTIHTSHRATRVSQERGTVTVHAQDEAGEEIAVRGDAVLVAVGRRPNSDTLNLGVTDVEVDEREFIKHNEYLETTAQNVWTQGDIAGNAQFKHAGDYETRHTIANVVHEERKALDMTALPHAIFAEPQVAGVGETEAELRAADRPYEVGRANYADSSMGRAKKLEHGFLKILASPSGEILGAHVIGYEAAALLHEVVVAKRTGATVSEVADTIHAHPTLSKVVESGFRDVELQIAAVMPR